MIESQIIKLIDMSLGDFTQMGGKGSGHWRHAGRKGKRGGSAPSKGGLKVNLRLMYDMETKKPKAKAGLEAMVGNLPESHQEIVSKWNFIAMGEETDTAEEIFMPYFVDPRDRTVNIVAGELARQNPAIYHEFGHLVYDTEENKSLKDWSYPLAKEMKPLGRSHVYAKTETRQKREWFSDAYELYQSDKKALKDLSSNVFAFMDNTMKGA